MEKKKESIKYMEKKKLAETSAKRALLLKVHGPKSGWIVLLLHMNQMHSCTWIKCSKAFNVSFNALLHWKKH
jgi:hypothetical protein